MFATKHKKSLKPNIDSHGGAYVGLAKSLFRFFCEMLQKNLNEKFGQPILLTYILCVSCTVHLTCGSLKGMLNLLK